MASKMGTMWKKNKKEMLVLIILGAVILFLINNFTVQPAYDVISCTWNQHECNITADCEHEWQWNGECTAEIIDECCIPVDMCNGQRVTNPYECYHFYCMDEDKYCEATYDEEGGSGEYICGCKTIYQGPI